MFVANHMTPDPQTVDAGAPVAKAQEILRAGSFHQLPVVDGNQNLLGIVTDRDIRSAVGYHAETGTDLRVEEVMTSDPVCIEPSRTIEDAVLMFCRHHFGALPVLHGRRLVGIITRTDLLRAFHDLLGLDACGSRIEIAIPNGPADVSSVMSMLSEEDEICSIIAARLRTDGAEPVLYVRTTAQNPWQLERRLRASGAILLAPETAPASGQSLAQE